MRTKVKLTSATEVIKIRDYCFKQVEVFRKKISKELYEPVVKSFIKDHILYKVGKVYNLVEGGKRRKGFKRFVIYEIQPQFFFQGRLLIRVCGWWLDDSNNNSPFKWDSMVVYGVGNKAVFKLAENQNTGPVPEYLKNNI